MANILDFDGNGRVDLLSDWQSGTGDFTITLPSVEYQNATEVIVGDFGSASVFIACIAGGIIRVRGTGTEISVGGHTAGEFTSITLSRSSGTVTLTTGVGTANNTSSNDMKFNVFGTYSSGSLKYNGQVGGVCTFTNGTDDRSYDMDQALLATTIPDTISSQTGTLTGFTTGGFIESPGPFISITAFDDYQFFKDEGAGSADITISGNMANLIPAPDIVEWKRGQDDDWTTLDASPTSTVFSGVVSFVGQDDISVRVGNNTTIIDTKLEIAVCTYLIQAGQSNTDGRGRYLQKVKPCGGFDAFMVNAAGTFSKMSDPTGDDIGLANGSWLPLLANKYLALGQPIAMANVAAGGTTISAWVKPSTSWSAVANAVGRSNNGATAVIMNLGETDAGGTTEVNFKADMNDFVDDVFTDFGIPTYIVKMVQGTSVPQPGGDNVRQWVQDVIDSNANAFFGGDLSVIDIDTPTGADHLHMKTTDNLEEAADIIGAELITSATLTSPLPLGNSAGAALTASNVNVSVKSLPGLVEIGTNTVNITEGVAPTFTQQGTLVGVSYNVTFRDNATGDSGSIDITAT